MYFKLILTNIMRMMMLLINMLIVCLIGLSDYVHGQEECDSIIDLTLIVDSSGSITPDDFEKGKLALLDLVSRLDVSVRKAGVAVINYASDVSLSAQTDVFEFNKTELLQQISVLPRLATNTATGNALTLAKRYCEARCRDLNEGVPRIFAIFTDGRSNEGLPVIPAANAIRNAPIEGTIFAVGIGNIGKKGQDELLGIAGDRDYVMNIDSYLDLARVTNAITMKMCEFPAFILPDIKTQVEMKANNTRYYKMHTLHKLAKNAFFDIEVNDKIGQSVVYTSTTNKNPILNASKSISTRAATGGKIYTTYVSANTEHFYFSIKSVESNINKFDFVVRVRV